MKNGKLTVAENLLISSQLTKSEFLVSQVGHQAQLVVNNLPYTKYRFTAPTDLGLLSVLTLTFVGEILRDVNIYPLWTKESTQWTDSQQLIEQANKLYNDTLLEKLLGDPPYKYSWGEIMSIYDQKGGSSSIIIRYY
jgi:hypothetical protein